MAKTWATSGPDLHLDLADGRVRAGLESALRDAVQTGRLPSGARLPSSRALAQDLGLARNTVAEAYSQLIAEGWLTARQGSGTRVADRVSAEPAAAATTAIRASAARFDLRAGVPDLSLFPRAEWLAAARHALSAAPDAALGYPDPRGRLELRQALAAYLARARGVRTTPDRLVVCSGFTQGLALLCEALRAHGTSRLAIEGHAVPSYRDIAAAHGLRASTVSVDSHGAVVAELGDADVTLLTPAHQFPLGVVLAPARRTQAVKWAIDTPGWIIEDDYDGEFRYDRQPVGAMQALAPEHVIYAGTASKTLAPGLRLGWLALPAQLIDPVITAKTSADRNTSIIDELILARFITSGAYDRHVRRARLAYRRRRDRLTATLQRHAPHVTITGIAAGLHALAQLPDDHDEHEIVTRAAHRDLTLEGLGAYRARGQHHAPALVIGYATPPEHAYTTAIGRLSAVLSGAQS